MGLTSLQFSMKEIVLFIILILCTSRTVICNCGVIASYEHEYYELTNDTYIIIIYNIIIKHHSKLSTTRVLSLRRILILITALESTCSE